MTETPRSATTVAVIGTGEMGSAMARRLLDRGHSIRVWDRSPGPLEALATAGAEVAGDPQEAVTGAAVVLTMLPTADVVTGLMIGGGAIDAMATGAAWAQMGTIGVRETAGLDSAVRHRRPDVMFVDAPVSGSRIPAERGELKRSRPVAKKPPPPSIRSLPLSAAARCGWGPPARAAG